MTSGDNLLDLPVLDELRETTGDDVFLEIGETFSEQTALLIGRLDEAARLGDFEAIERNAHELTGAAGTFGATALSNLSRKIMLACRTRDTGRTQDLIEPLIRSGQATLAAFARYCTELS